LQISDCRWKEWTQGEDGEALGISRRPFPWLLVASLVLAPAADFAAHFAKADHHAERDCCRHGSQKDQPIPFGLLIASNCPLPRDLSGRCAR